MQAIYSNTIDATYNTRTHTHTDHCLVGVDKRKIKINKVITIWSPRAPPNRGLRREGIPYDRQHPFWITIDIS